MDIEGSGSLDIGELRKALEVLGIGASEAECAALFSRVDADHSGTIDKDEFIRFSRGDDSNP